MICCVDGCGAEATHYPRVTLRAKRGSVLSVALRSIGCCDAHANQPKINHWVAHAKSNVEAFDELFISCTQQPIQPGRTRVAWYPLEIQ